MPEDESGDQGPVFGLPPGPAQLFDTTNVAIETACLLASSFACGMASLAVAERNQKWTQISLLATGLLGAAFLVLELKEF